ncbi:Hypothetical predicted protein [Marmota monax]|uniref:Uncharacterized protein n=1 Tax=Marmota monax TaxID=9995 RepID=A0A5E4CMS5_MARMO|nr:hypothetical protein GHT09_011464 [Marmota monax]VTJ82650.1 Hypothetical predicted protein [Marmota monax]
MLRAEGLTVAPLGSGPKPLDAVLSLGRRRLTWYLHLALQLAIGGATCGRALRLARPDQPALAPRLPLQLAQPSMQP